jgi:tetratricopeptide (TPR) repeat protein
MAGRRIGRYAAAMRVGGRVRGRAGVLVWIAATCASVSTACPAGDPESPGLAMQCRKAAEARQDTAIGLCLADYGLTRDAAAGARAARALQSRPGALPVIEWLASAIGDSAAGADAWLAAGVGRGVAGDVPGALAAYERAVAMRGARDALGQLRDAVGLLYHYLGESDYRAAAGQATLAYDLASLVDRPADRAAAYINIATMMLNIGNLSTTAQVLDEARCLVPVTSPQYARLRQLDGLTERGLGHPAQARLALAEANAFAIRDRNRDLEWETRFNIIDLAIREGALDDAAGQLAAQARTAGTGRDDRAVLAYFRGLLELARGNPGAAVQLVERALPDARDSWISYLERVHGRALALAGDPARAEQALLRAAAAVERARDALDSDTFKSWMLADQRAPFEDLFLLHVTAGRLADALGVVQRATARSTLDGLLGAEPGEPSLARSIAAAVEHSGGMRMLARSLRSSHATPAPPIAEVLARLRGNHVISYFRARSELWAIAIARDGALRVRNIGSAAEIAAQVLAWRRDLEATRAADELGARLLPDELMPPPGTPLYIVQEDPIAEVAFAALRRRGELVLDHHPVAYAPSAAVLSVTRRSRSSIHAMVLGDPTGDLPQAREEAKEVADHLKVVPRLGTDAALAAVLDAGDATLIHIAAHTVPTQAGAALRLADGLLDAGAVLDHGVAAGAIVLLTCSSAPITSRDELAPLASAFLAAGAHTVVASRWAVADDVARKFARTFYRANGVAEPVQATAVAQRELVRQHVPVEQWSTFAIIGGLP